MTQVTEAGVALFLPLLLIPLSLLHHGGATGTSGTNTTHHKSTCNQPDCLRCDLSTAECVKCLYVMMAATRRCYSTCPSGYSTSWPTHSHLMGRVCTERSMLALVSGRDVTIIAASAVGGAVCVGVVIGALLYMRRRTKPSPDHHQHHGHSHNNNNNNNHHHRYPLPRVWRDKRPSSIEKPVADEERSEFLEQLACLRGEAGNFLEMLSHTRNRFRTLGGPDAPADTKTKAYRAVVRDLSRVLTLLNRREDHILTVPGDWRRLLSWAARVLARYKRQKAAKESGDLPCPDPLNTGGTLYQTRRQAQAERTRLVVQAAPPPLPPAPSTVSLSSTPSFSDADSRSFHQSLEDSFEDLSRSQMGSRTVSLMSLTPIIMEEDDDDILYEDHLPTPPSDDSPRSSVDHTFRMPGIMREYEKPQRPNIGYSVENEDALLGDRLVAEKNNNNITTKPPAGKFHFNKGKGDSVRSALSIREQIMNLRNMEHLLEARNVDKYITSDTPSPKEEHDLKEANPRETELNKAPESPVDISQNPIKLDTDPVNTSFSGTDVYTSVIRKPVALQSLIMLSGDPYRDDTIDSGSESLSCHDNTSSKAKKANHPVLVVSCNAEAKRHILAPRIELTTEL